MPRPNDDFDAAWARIVDDLTASDADGPAVPSDADSPGEAPGRDGRSASAPEPDPATGDRPVDDPDGAAATATPESPAEQREGLEALFAPLRSQHEPGTADGAADTWEDEGHYVPPPPPEIPQGTPLTRLAWAGAIGGPLVLLLIAMTGWEPPSIVAYAAGLGCLLGFATLVWQLPESREDGWDDGTRL